MDLTISLKHRSWIPRTSLFIFTLLLGTVDSYDVVDGVTAASTIATPTPPTLQITATPNIVNGTIQAVVGQPLTINLRGTDPNGYSTLYVGIVQGNYLYNKQSSLPVPLPAGAVFNLATNPKTNAVDPTKATLTWTPTAASSNTSTSFKFAALNTYWGTSSMQSVAVKVIDNTAPSFDTSVMSTNQTIVLGNHIKMPVTVNADTDSDNLVISVSNLPSEAEMGDTAKNAKGQWVAIMDWTPTAEEIGTTAVTFTAQDNNETAVSSYTVNFVVQNNTTPQFAASMPSLQKVYQNTPVGFKVAVNPDSFTNNVLITATGLPKGASLSKPALVNKQVIATLNWKPDATQIGKSFPVVFTAEDNVAGAVPVMFTTTFTVAPHISVISK